MKVISGVGKIKEAFRSAVLAIGVFDGVHVGHRKLIEQAVRKARSIGGEAVVMTFSPHPVHVLHPKIYLPLIISLRYRLKLIEELGVSKCIVIKFTKSFSRLSPQKFIQKYLVDVIKPKEVFVGDDFRFGQNRSGSMEFFKEAGKKLGFKVNGIHPVGKNGDEKIGSSTIRKLISEGKLKEAVRLLGRDIATLEVVRKGDGRGRKLGFPTANLHPDNQVIPPVGVYAARVVFKNRSYDAMANIGKRPSFKVNGAVNVEVHLFDFEGNLYDQEICVSFLEKIRDEKKFASKEKLIEQLKKDRISARTILEHSSSFPTPAIC